MVRTWGVVLWILVFAVALAVVLRFAPPARAQTGVGLVLNEILAGPARDWDGDGLFDARKDEWVEVKNEGPSAVDLASYRLADADSTIRFAFSGTLAPGGVVLVTGAAALDWQHAAGRSATGLSLNNAGDTIHLFQVGAGDTVDVDVKAYNSIEGASDRSTGRLGGSWVLFDALNKYTGSGDPKGSGCPPTPGTENGCTAKLSATTWGWLKATYR